MSRKKTVTQLIALMMVICIFFSLAPVQASAATSDYTRIYWVQTDDSRITDATLREQVQLFSQELQAHGVTTDCLPIIYGEESNTQDRDIVLILDSSLNITDQGYQVAAENNRVTVSASDEDGLFYGCRYVIKQLKLGKSVANKTSAPAVAERGLSLDNGRKYYSVTWIEKMIRELSWAEMNTLVLHFTEEMGIGIESMKYPWLNGRDGRLCTQDNVETDNRVLTQEEVKDIIAYAKKYHVEIIPSLDSPGHMNYMVKKFEAHCASTGFSFTYGGKTYNVPAGQKIHNYFKYGNNTTDVVPGSSVIKDDYATGTSRGIDISNEIAVAFTKSLISEYAELFREAGCTKFDIGGDELLGWGAAAVSTSTASRWKQLDHWKNHAQSVTGDSRAVAYDAFLLYMNDLNEMLRKMQYTSVRMWNDDVMRSDAGWNKVVKLDTDIDIWYWSGTPQKAATYANAGHGIYNIMSDYNYYAMTSDYFSDNRDSFIKSYPDKIYDEWSPYNFGSGGTCSTNVLGSAFGIWSDNPTLRSEDEVMEDVLPMLRAHGAKAWDPNANSSKNYSSFTDDWATLGACVGLLQDAPTVTTLNTAAFRTKNVRSGGTAVLRLIVPNTVTESNITLTDSSNKSVTFTTVRIPGETVADGKQALYLKFTVTGIGSQTYTATVNGEAYFATVNIWKPAQ